MSFLFLAYLLLLNSTLTLLYPSGAPSSACTSITPTGHGGSSGTLPGGFYLYANIIDCGGNYSANQAYTIRLQGSVQFRGFLIQARQSGTTTPIGSFTSLPSGTQTLSCSGVATASVTHTSNDLKTSVEFTWNSPSTAGTVEFRYAVVVERNTYYADINAGNHRPSGSACTSTAGLSSSINTVSDSSLFSSSTQLTETVMPPSSTISTSTMISTMISTSSIISMSTSSEVQPTPTSTPECPPGPLSDNVYTFRRGTTGVGYYFAARVNPDNPNYVDMTLEADTTGWVGIGFSTDRLMGNDDVLACHRSPSSDIVAVVDTWNPNPRYTPNQLDPNQNGVCTHSTQFVNGRIICTFSRLILGMERDHNLNDTLYQLYATSSTRGVGSLAQHDSTPDVTTEPLILDMPSSTISTTISTSSTSVSEIQPTPTSTPECPPGPLSDDVYTFRRGTTGDDYYFAARVNPDNLNYLDMTLEANTTGWVGIGFSTDRLMGNDDVLACHRSSSSDTVTVVDTWNPNPRYTPNQLDPNQNGVCTHSTQFVNGRIICTFSRLILGMERDHNLNDTLYQLYATSSTRGVGSLAQHDSTPDVTTEPLILDMPSSTISTTISTSSTSVSEIQPTPTSTPECPPGHDDVYTFRQGTTCVGYYFAVRVNPDNLNYLDMTLKADTTVWGNDDVLACHCSPSSDIVAVVDTWNPNPVFTVLGFSIIYITCVSSSTVICIPPTCICSSHLY